MKKCVGFGNCQVQVLGRLLKEFTNFSEIYEIETFANWEMIDPTKTASAEETAAKFLQATQQADVVIVQPLGDHHGCYSTNIQNPNSFLKLLKPDCKVVSFPRMYNSAFFPLFQKKDNSNIFVGEITNLPKSLDETLDMYDKGLLDFNLKASLQKNYEIAKKKEDTTDCKLIDYIYSILPYRRAFLTQDHPTMICYVELLRQVASLLGLHIEYERALQKADEDENYIGHIEAIYKRPDKQLPLSNYAIQQLGLKFVESETEETRLFYRNIIKHFYLVKQLGFAIEYPYFRTVANGIEYTDQIKEFFVAVGLSSVMNV
jgi:hypothetical protein